MPYLKYLFTSLHENEEYIIQDQSDTSKLAPGRNAFYDVLENIKGGNGVKMFCLVNQEQNQEGKNNDYLVDLRNGQFVINGAPLFLHDISQEIHNIRLIFYKTRKEHFVGGANIGSETIYHLGWQANDKEGRNVQQVISII